MTTPFALFALACVILVYVGLHKTTPDNAQNDAKEGSTANDQNPSPLPPHRCQG